MTMKNVLICLLIFGYTLTQQNILQAQNPQNIFQKGLIQEEGADPNGVDEEGDSALHYAAENNCVSTMAVLMDAGAELDMTSDSGRTSLMRAVWNGRTQAAQWLLERGATRTLRDIESRTPMDVAIDDEMKRMLCAANRRGRRRDAGHDSGEAAALTYLLPDATGQQADLYLQMYQVPPCIQPTGDRSVRIALNVNVGQARRALLHVNDSEVGVSVVAPSREGLANAELADYMAKVLGCTKAQLRLERGWSAQSKYLLVSGLKAVDVFKRLKAGDCYVQNGTRHAWRNPGDVDCVLAAVAVGAKVR